RDRASGRVLQVTGLALTNLSPPPALRLSASEALARALTETPGEMAKGPPLELGLDRTRNGTFRLVYRFRLTNGKYVDRLVDVDANDGSIANSVSLIRN